MRIAYRLINSMASRYGGQSKATPFRVFLAAFLIIVMFFSMFVFFNLPIFETKYSEPFPANITYSKRLCNGNVCATEVTVNFDHRDTRGISIRGKRVKLSFRHDAASNISFEQGASIKLIRRYARGGRMYKCYVSNPNCYAYKIAK